MFWPDVYLEQGHWLPTVVWANGLKKLGHTVKYMGIEDCASVVAPFGYTVDAGSYHVVFSDLYPLGYTRSNQGSISERWKPDHVFAIAQGALDELFLGNNKPDLLVSGYFTSLESLCIHYRYDIPFVITTTYLRHPQDDPAIRALQNLMAFPRAVALQLMRDVIGDHWKTIYDSYEIEDFVKPLENVDELIPCPRDFEFSHYAHGDLVHFVEPCISPLEDGRINKYATTYDAVSDELKKQTSAFFNSLTTGKSCIFASAGSQVQDYEQKAERLFGALIDMMNSPQMANYHLILSVGPKLIQKDWGTSDKYTVVSWAPQRALLERAQTVAAFIHGGLATIKECIYFNKPFVILPLGKDQVDNALRLREKGIANMAYVDRVDADSLLLALSKARTDTWMANRRGKMGAVFGKLEDTDKPGLQILLDNLA